MSERKLRELADTALDSLEVFIPGVPLIGKLDKALSEPPDVVALLRWAMEQMSVYYGDPDAVRAYEHMVFHITDEFRVRLTDDGWEWVEEGE